MGDSSRQASWSLCEEAGGHEHAWIKAGCERVRCVGCGMVLGGAAAVAVIEQEGVA